VVNGFRANDHVVVQDSDLAPSGTNGVLSRQASKVLNLTLLGDLDECSTAELANDTELASVLGSPSPGRRTTTLGATNVGVVGKVVEVDVVATESLVGIALLDNGKTLLALNLLLLAEFDGFVVLP
jgi:hypothetical protein